MNFMLTIPIIKAMKNAKTSPKGFIAIFSPSIIILIISINSEPIITGMLIRKENFALFCLSAPESSPAEIVAPEREIPGKIARPWAIPIATACLKVNSSVFALLFENLSTINKSAEVIKNAQGKNSPSNELEISGINTIAIRHVIIVEIDICIVSFENGCFAR